MFRAKQSFLGVGRALSGSLFLSFGQSAFKCVKDELEAVKVFEGPDKLGQFRNRVRAIILISRR